MRSSRWVTSTSSAATSVQLNRVIAKCLRFAARSKGQKESASLASSIRSPRSGPLLKLVEISSAPQLDRLAGEWLAGLANGNQPQEIISGQAVADQLLAPLLPHLSEGDEMFIVADAGL